MNGTKYLLDTNFILGILKSTPDVLEIMATPGLNNDLKLLTLDQHLMAVVKRHESSVSC